MQVAVLLLNRGRGSGGVARQHVRALLARGHEVTFMHPDMGGGVPGASNVDVPLHSDVRPVHEYLPGAAGSQRAVSKMETEQALAYADDLERALVAQTGTDLILGHHGNVTSAATRRAAHRLGVPYVLFLHGTGIEPRHHGGYADEVWAEIATAIEQAAGIIVTTEYVRDELVQPLVTLPEERFLVLPCGVDMDEFRPDAVADVVERYDLPDTFVICPGAVTALKGTPNVVAATRQYADLAPTIFIGDGDMREELEAELGDRGRFLGFVTDEDKAALINAATILTAAPEKKEHFGIIYIEAMAAGTVPVAFEGGGVDSIVSPDVGVLTPRDSAHLGAAVRQLLEDPDRCRRMAEAGRRRVARLFDDRRLQDTLVDWLETFV